MEEDKDRQRKVNTCLEGSPCAEMMQKIMGEQGCGSLCEEMMRSLMKTRRDSQEKRRESEKNEGPGGKD